jgi:hypothetical protein
MITEKETVLSSLAEVEPFTLAVQRTWADQADRDWPQQAVLASAFTNHVMEYDAAPAATGCRVPVAHISSYIGTVNSMSTSPKKG